MILLILKVYFRRVYARLGKTWAKNSLLHQNQIVTTLQKQVFKQEVGEAEGKSEITAISHKYKNTLNNFIDSSDTESSDRLDSLNRPGLIDKGLCNVSWSRGHSPTFLEEDYFDKDILVTSLVL